MSGTNLLAFATLALLVLCATPCVMLIRQRVSAGWRIFIVGVFAMICTSVVAAGTLFRGWPTPTTLDSFLLESESAEVLGGYVEPEKQIFMTLLPNGTTVPKLYSFPWDARLAEQLQQGLQAQREGESGGLFMRKPFEPTLDPRAPKFYQAPQPMMPPKDHSAPPPIEVPEVDA